MPWQLNRGLGIYRTEMSERRKEKICELRFTTKKSGKGWGITIAYQIITEKHGGAIICQLELGKGTDFIISLPLN
ncbi:MAG: ATP-binding protein [Cyanobacteria bacterium P01_E01_bin.42]